VAFSVSALVLFGIIVVIFIRNKQLKTSHAILSALFGFMLSQSTAAGPIKDFLTQMAKTISSVAS
jgi:intracellular septation protein A